MNSDLEEIKSRLNIVDVLGEYIRLERAGANYRANCPFHNEKSPSFMVSEDKQIWHCFGCQKGGDIFGFVMEIEGLEFRDALKLLAEKAGVELKRGNPQEAAQKSKTLEILELATKFYQAHLLQTPAGKKIQDYLHDRGLNDESIKDFRLGYAPNGWKHTINFLTKKGFTEQEIAKTGLLVESQKNNTDKYYDRFRDRIMFPIADTNSKVVGYSARVAPGGDESQAKYVNTPETEVYHKSKILYGINRAKGEIRQSGSVLLVEGNMDVIAAHQAGLKNTVAVSGTALTQEHLGIIKRYTDNIRMCFDMDSAGEQATKKSIKLCFEKEANVHVVQLPAGKDAADLAKNDPAALRESVEKAKAAMDYFFDKTFAKYDRHKVEDKKVITEELLEMIGYLANEIEKSHWIKKLADMLEVQESVLTDMLKKARLRDRVAGKSENNPVPNDDFVAKTKLETLTDDLLGLMLVYPEVWKKIIGEQYLSLLKDSLLNILIEKGEMLQFRFDDLVKVLSEENVTRAEKLFFEKKYRIGLDNNIEEMVSENVIAESEECLREIHKEILKGKLEKITHDLKDAEGRKDNAAISFLRKEFKNISEELYLN